MKKFTLHLLVCGSQSMYRPGQAQKRGERCSITLGFREKSFYSCLYLYLGDGARRPSCLPLFTGHGMNDGQVLREVRFPFLLG